MPPRLHARPKRSTRQSEGTACSRLPRLPVSTASARHDGRRRHECGIQDREALVQARAPLVEIGDPLNLEVVADLLSADATQIEKGAAVRIDGWGGTALQVTRTRQDFSRYRRSESRSNGSVP